MTTITDLRAAIAAAKGDGDRIVLVPTMGALHDGHLANVRVASGLADTVVVSIFVNPTQFDRADDLAAYPRDLEADEDALRGLGPDTPHLVFAPSESEVYPRPTTTTVHVAGVTDRLEGASRPGHFDGVATVVTKLFNLVQPDVAVFGRKDAQQNVVIRRLVEDLDVPVELVVTPTVREPDGLALSSRNRRLDADARRAALVVPQALASAVHAAREARAAGDPVTPARLRAAAAATLAAVPEVDVDYLEVVDPETFTPPDGAADGEENRTASTANTAARGEERDGSGMAAADGHVRLVVAVAATVGGVRLIDNVEVGDPDDEQRLLAATATTTTS